MISVLIVAYNSGEVLQRSVASIGCPPANDVEVVVVDNASSDGCCDGLEDRFPWIKLVTLRSNRGFGAATNHAASKATGDAFLLLNSDAWLEDDALIHLAEKLTQQDELAMTVPTLLYPDGGAQFGWSPTPGVVGEVVQKVRNRCEGWRWAHGPFEQIWRRLAEPGWFTAACMLVRRSAFEEVGGFDEAMVMYYEDADLCQRLQQRGWKLERVDSAVVRHVRGGSLGPDWLEMERRRSQMRFYRKHRPVWEIKFLVAHLRRKCPEGPIAEWLKTQRFEPLSRTEIGRGRVEFECDREMPEQPIEADSSSREYVESDEARRCSQAVARLEDLRRQLSQGAARGEVSKEIAQRSQAQVEVLKRDLLDELRQHEGQGIRPDQAKD
ncbi:MAG: glycosyltransferase family 2 protein [bacterium]|nr:glycosyltransferase family 2 protein [bacterium]